MASLLAAEESLRTVARMLKLVIVFLAIWAMLAVAVFAIKGLFWLAVVGILLAAATVVIGATARINRNTGLSARAPARSGPSCA